MLINKIFHVHQPIDEARRHLKEIGSYQAFDVASARFGKDGVGHFELKTRLGQRIEADIQEVDSENPDCVLFRSIGGDVDLAGMVEFFSIRPNLTEVVLTLDYDLVSPLQRAMDRVTAVLDSFVNRQLVRLENYLLAANRPATALHAHPVLAPSFA